LFEKTSHTPIVSGYFMRNLIYVILMAGLFLSFQMYAKPPALEVFAKHSSYNDMKISPTGKYIAFTFSEGTQVKLGIMERESMKPTASFEFGKNRHVRGFQWLNNERVGMTVQTVIGLYDGTNPDTKWAAGNADGSNRKILWDFEHKISRVSILTLLKDEPDYVLLSKWDWRDGGKVKPLRMNINTGAIERVVAGPFSARHSNPGVTNLFADLNEEIRFAIESDRGKDRFSVDDDSRYIHYKDSEGRWSKLSYPNKRAGPPIVRPYGISEDNRKFYFVSNHDQIKSDTLGLFEFDIITKKISLIYRNEDVDVGSPILGLSGGREGGLIGVRTEPGYPSEFYIESPENAEAIKMRKSLSAVFKNQKVGITSRTEDGNLYVVSVSSDRNPGQYYLFDKKDNKISLFAESKPEVNPTEMARVEPFTINARDGLKMYGLLTIPNNVIEKNLPTIIYPHGGPYGAADTWRWDRRAQMLASRGYLVIQLNFRGSGGFGEDFYDAGETEWGAKMQDDLTDVTLWAIKSGLTDPEKVCLHGASYGGYAAMNAVVKEPDLYRCSIPDAGIYEMKIQWDEADSFKRRHGNKLKENYMKQMIGGYQYVKERSPVYHVDKLKAALLIVHGGEDERTPIINAEVLEEHLRAAGKPYETLYKEEEGHGFSKVENRVELYQRMLDFLEKHIGPGAQPIN